jgi:hypothetical protein
MLGVRISMAQDGEMKPPLFDYYDPRTEAETLALLAAYGPDAKPVSTKPWRLLTTPRQR